MQTIRDHFLLTGQLLPLNRPWKGGVGKIFYMNNVRIYFDFGNGDARVMQFDSDNIITALTDWPKKFCEFSECLSHWTFSNPGYGFINYGLLLLMAVTFYYAKI